MYLLVVQVVRFQWETLKRRRHWNDIKQVSRHCYDNEQGRTYHWGLGGARAPPPIGLAPPPNFWGIKKWGYFYNDSVESLKFYYIFCKGSEDPPQKLIIFINRSINLNWKLTNSILSLIADQPLEFRHTKVTRSQS